VCFFDVDTQRQRLWLNLNGSSPSGKVGAGESLIRSRV